MHFLYVFWNKKDRKNVRFVRVCVFEIYMPLFQRIILPNTENSWFYCKHSYRATLCYQKLSFICQCHYSDDSVGSCVLLTSFFHSGKGKCPGVISHTFCPISEIICFSQKILFLIVEMIFGMLGMLILMGCHWFSILFPLKVRWLAFIFFIICWNYIKVGQGQSGLVFIHSE